MTYPIIVTGIPRSGTSMVGRILHYHGLHYGRERGHNRHNPHGLFETSGISEALKGVLADNGYDPMGRSPLPSSDLSIDLATLRETIHSALCPMHCAFFKECKAALLHPILKSIFPRSPWIVVRRSREKHVASLASTPFMVNCGDADAADAYITAYEAFLDKIGGFDLSSDQIIQRDYRQLHHVLTSLGILFSKQETERAVDRSIFHAST